MSEANAVNGRSNNKTAIYFILIIRKSYVHYCATFKSMDTTNLNYISSTKRIVLINASYNRTNFSDVS